MPRMILAPAQNPSSPPSVPRRRFLGGLLAGLASGSLLSQARAAFAAPNATLAYQPFIGELSIVGFNFAPVGWALCDGSLLSIASNTALFSLIGTYYGGNGINTFGLPDLRGRFPIGTDNYLYPQGAMGGEANHTLSIAELPPHAHSLNCDPNNGTADNPAGAIPARNPAGIPAWSTAAPGAVMGATAIGPNGSGYPHNNLPPYTALNFIIATQGIFPSRA